MKVRNLRNLIFVLFLCLLSLQTEGKVWTVNDLPVSYLQDRTQHVSDPEHLMGESFKAVANSYLDSLENEFNIQSVFIVVSQVPNADCFRFAEDFGNKYGVGTKKDRNGIVIVLSVDDRRYFIAPGKGLEEYLTDVECHDIGQNCIVQNMKADNLNAAVSQTAQAIYWNLKGDSTHYDSIVTTASSGQDDDLGIVVLWGLLLFGAPMYMLLRLLLVKFGFIIPRKDKDGKHHHDNDINNFFPPFFFGGGGSSWGGGSSGGSFGGGSFGGGGGGGGW